MIENPLDQSIANDVINEQLREMQNTIRTLQDTVSSLDSEGTDDVVEVIPPLLNFIDNGDFVYHDEAYNVNGTTYTGYTDDDKVLANWYRKRQDVFTAYAENTSGTEGTDSIRSTTHPSPHASTNWLESDGSVYMTGGRKIAGRINKMAAFAGNYMVARLQISNTGDTIAEDIKLKISIWDNTALEILKGSVQPVVTPALIGSHSGGTVTREYILEVQMPDGRKFYSDSVTPASIANTVPVTSIDSDDYVDLTWDTVVGATRYRVYRRTPALADTDWYLVETITNGTTSMSDFGGTGGGVWTFPTIADTNPDNSEFQYAQSFYDDIGEILQTSERLQEVSLGIQIPYNFVPNGNQFLQIEFVQADYTDTDLSDVPADSIRIDKVGLSYTNGRWSPSARDLVVQGTPIVADPPPSEGGDGGNPDAGTGNPTCVEENVPILVWDDGGNHFYMPANEIVLGDRLVSWDGEKFAPSKVMKVIKGISNTNYINHFEWSELPCSFSHRLIKDLNDFEKGTGVKYIEETTLAYRDGEMFEEKIIAKEIIKEVWKVRTWNLQKGKRNYIAAGFLCHNVKASS